MGEPARNARPQARHQDLIGALGDDIRRPFRRGRGGPGGWWIYVTGHEGLRYEDEAGVLCEDWGEVFVVCGYGLADLAGEPFV